MWGSVLVLAILGFLVTWAYVQPAPPKRIRIAAGSEDGAYYKFAQQYRDLLKSSGIQLDIVPTSGSVQNLELLQKGDASLGFVQGGTARPGDAANLESLASLYFEPLWVFYRAEEPIDSLLDLHGKRIGIGPPGSGTQALASQLLTDNGISPKSATLVQTGLDDSARRLESASLDAAFIVSSLQAPVIQKLLQALDVRLLGFKRHLAYERKYRYLSAVTLGEGSVDLIRNIPPQDTILLAPAANLVARKDFHPALVPVLLEVATEVHAEGGMFADPDMFPSSRFAVFLMDQQARRFLKSGPTFLYRVFPFWAASLIDRLKILLLPLITVLIPLMKLAPPLYRWRIRSKIYRWYRVLREVDLELARDRDPEKLLAQASRLKEIAAEVNEVSVPAAYMEEFYNLRMHIELMRARLERRSGIAS